MKYEAFAWLVQILPIYYVGVAERPVLLPDGGGVAWPLHLWWRRFKSGRALVHPKVTHAKLLLVSICTVVFCLFVNRTIVRRASRECKVCVRLAMIRTRRCPADWDCRFAAAVADTPRACYRRGGRLVLLYTPPSTVAPASYLTFVWMYNVLPMIMTKVEFISIIEKQRNYTPRTI